MLHIEDSGKPKHLPASRAMLVLAADSDANVSISAATRAKHICLRLGRLHSFTNKALSFPLSILVRLVDMQPKIGSGDVFWRMRYMDCASNSFVPAQSIGCF
ncbi:hypothetical protein TNCV_688901 [Trichonephila clavipes]|nr:hypothetical protein TNCV_688901 [Trichonephila clavipes]